MFKREGLLFTFIILFVMLFSLNIVYAEEIDISTIDENAVLEETAGVTPDSVFYPVDKFFDNFADEVRVREEKVAEIRAMIEEGNFEAAREALERYERYAETLEREVSPEQRDEVRRSAAAIYNVLKSLESQIPDEDKDEFFDDIIEREGRIVTAVEIAGKIKELCEQLSELDPLEYSRVCKTDDDDPRWHRDLDRDLTEEQRAEAEEFFGIMSQCFETSGGTCRCEDISITAFANKCSVIAPLAYACEVEDNEAACDKMDAIEEEEPIEDLLPDYLREVLFRLENRYEDERFEHYGGPRECEGITDRVECEEKIFRLNAPRECVEELLEIRGFEFNRDYGVGEAQRDCEGIMFDLEAPFECKEAGLTDFRECGVLMFRLNAPPECLAAGLTGEYRSDERKCRDLVGGDFGPRDQGPVFNVNCAGIENPGERLACYDQGISSVHDYDVRYEETKEREMQCAQSCLAEGGAWDFSGGVCQCHFDNYEYTEPAFGDYPDSKEDYSQPSYDCALLDCLQGYYCDPYVGCVKDFIEEPPYDCALLDCLEGSYCDPYSGCIAFEEPTPEPVSCIEVFDPVCGANGKTYSNDCFAGLENAGIACRGECPCETGTLADETTNTEPTGAVITGNAFLDYYFR